MDAIAWLVAAGALTATTVLLAFAPRIHRDTRRRWAERGGGFAGIGSGLDAVWRPSAADAHAQWEAQLEVPAPSPAPGDKGLADGRIVIDVRRRRDGSDQRVVPRRWAGGCAGR